MKPAVIQAKKNFIGREFERNGLKKVASLGEASIIVMYGRRRIGKTELLEQTFKDRNILKFEGIEGLDEKEQLAHVIKQLAIYALLGACRKINEGQKI